VYAHTPQAFAGAFYIADIGTKGLSRAGAYVAAPDSLLAMHYNPAGLALLSGLHVEADITGSVLDFTFARSCPCVDPSVAGAASLDAMLQSGFKPAHTSSPLAIPFLGIAYGFPVMDLTVGFAVYGPNAGKYNYSPNLDPSKASFDAAAAANPERYAALNADTLQAVYQLAAAFRPYTGLRVGGSVMAVQNGNTQALHLWLNSATFGTQPENPELDVPISFHFTSGLLFNWSAGVSYDVLPGLTAGASFRGKVSTRADGTIDTHLPAFLASPPINGMVNGRDISVEINTAPIARFGVQYSLPRVFKVEGAFVYEGWSVYDRVVIRPKDITVSVAGMNEALGKIIQPRNWTNTYSIRIGTELNLLEPLLGLRAGYFYEPSAIPTNWLDNSRIDLNKHGVGLGASTTLFGFTVEIAGMYVALQSIDVKDSQVKLIGPLQPPLGAPTFNTVIGNGSYSGNYWLASASLSFALDPLLRL
jgi:long-subunit fatty acid transport protein